MTAPRPGASGSPATESPHPPWWLSWMHASRPEANGCGMQRCRIAQRHFAPHDPRKAVWGHTRVEVVPLVAGAAPVVVRGPVVGLAVAKGVNKENTRRE